MQAYSAPSLFQPHRARQALRDAGDGIIPPLIGVYLGLRSVPIARFIAPMGFDIVWIDWEHTSVNVETITSLVHEVMFMSEGKSIPFVRHAAIGFSLDAGASIVVPQVDTIEQARKIVSAAKFGAKVNSTHSAPPFRLIPGLTDGRCDPTKTLHQNLNEQTAIMIQVEALESIRNLPGRHSYRDCRVSMDLEADISPDHSEPEWIEAIQTVEMTMQKHAPRVGFGGFGMGDDATVLKRTKNKSFVVVGADTLALVGLMGSLSNARKFLPKLENKGLGGSPQD
ncbi:HpcH/HpaI aldolase/citrate lyase family protein [Colletotrichum cereale]|nr:HpcH/HpaI aldolase/citrate lyase family protein [Colletotrichum cereale]